MPMKIIVFMNRANGSIHCLSSCLHRTHFLKAWSWALLLMISLIIPRMSHSDDFEYKMKAGLKEEFTDNLFFDQDNEKEGWSTVLMTQAILKNSSDRLKTRLSGEWSRTFYEDYHDLNNDDWVVKSGIDWISNENTTCTMNLSIGEDSNIDTWLSSTGLLLNTEKHEFMKGDVSINQRFSERFSSELAVSYTDESTASNDDGSGDYSLTSKGVSAGMEFQINELTIFNLNSGYGFYDYGTNTVEQVYASLGMSRSVGERLSFFCNMGSRYTTYAYDVLVGIDMGTNPPSYIYDETSYSNWGFIGKTGFVFKNEDSSIRLTVDESLQPSTGKSQSMDRTSVDVSYNKRLSDDFTYRITSFYRLNRSDEKDASGDERLKTFGLSPGFSYQLMDDLSLMGSYVFTNYRSSGYQLRKNVYRIQLEYSF
jgi:hypothetical protein